MCPPFAAPAAGQVSEIWSIEDTLKCLSISPFLPSEASFFSDPSFSPISSPLLAHEPCNLTSWPTCLLSSSDPPTSISLLDPLRLSRYAPSSFGPLRHPVSVFPFLPDLVVLAV